MTQNNEHIKNFRIENFKRFQNFELSNIGQFNIVTGDNNIGKTTLLEALSFDEDSDIFADNLRNILFKFRRFEDIRKSYLEYFLYQHNTDLKLNFYFTTNSTEKQISIYKSSRETYFKLFNNEEVNLTREFNIDNIIPKHSPPYIPFYLGYDDDWTKYYANNIQKNRGLRKSLVAGMKTLIPNIENIEIDISDADKDFLLIVQSDNDAILPLAVFGESVIKLFRILIEVIINKGKRLMIDEIDTCIHYSRMKLFWKTLLKLAKDNDVQLFVTTHNKECLNYFKEVLEEDLKEYQPLATLFTLDEMTDKSVKASRYDFNSFEKAIDKGVEIRGK